MRDFIPVNEPLLKGNEKKYLIECIDSGWISSEGPFVDKFEKEFAKKVGRKYGIAVSNGTAALEIAAIAVGIQSGDEVIMPTFTIISCAQAISKLGGVIVPIDCSLTDFNLITDEIESKITNKTKAILPVHIYGLPVDMDKILELAAKYRLKVIEDAAEMHGQTYKGKPCGSFGDVSVFSFYANKIITTGEGGMIVTDNEAIADKCRYYRNLCFEKEKRFVHNEIGYNYRFTNIQAALGLAQLENIEEFIELKKGIGRKYNELLSSNSKIYLLPEKNEYAENIYWVYPIVLKSTFEKDAVYVMKKLANKGIGTRPFFYPMHLQPILLKNKSIKTGLKLPNSEYLSEMGFYIPSSMTLTDEEIHFIANTINEIIS